MKNFIKAISTTALLFSSLMIYAVPPLEYVTALRNESGKVRPSVNVLLKAEITSDISGENVLYSETQSLTTDSNGLLKAYIGEGVSESPFSELDWDGKRFLKTTVSFEDSPEYSLGVVEIAAVPKATIARTADKLIRKSPSGASWELSVNDNGDTYWKIISGEIIGHEPNYDQSRVPENLYFIGTFNGWNVSEAIPMIKHSATKFSIVRYINRDEIFKFVPAQKWENDYDWSSVTLNIGTPNAMREKEDCPQFTGTPGNYEILVDFYDFTLTLTPQ